MQLTLYQQRWEAFSRRPLPTLDPRLRRSDYPLIYLITCSLQVNYNARKISGCPFVHVPLRNRTFSSRQRTKIIKISGLMVSLRNDYASLFIVIIRAREVTFNYMVRMIVALGRDFQKSN